jgi:glycosyltransferase involved in cell wall biosynthesis
MADCSSIAQDLAAGYFLETMSGQFLVNGSWMLRQETRRMVERKLRRFLVRRLEDTGKLELLVAPEEMAAADWTRAERNAGGAHNEPAEGWTHRSGAHRGDGELIMDKSGRDEELGEKRAGERKLAINWVIPPMDVGSGGHTTIFRMVRYLEARGHTCRLYLYRHNPNERISMDSQQANYAAGWPEMTVALRDANDGMESADVIMATSWETAYQVFNAPSEGVKCYFVQDFEPAFFPMGSNYILAENTYRFGFKGITAGGWLAQKLSEEYGMECGAFDFGSDAGVYRYENDNPRKDVFFYARPHTARRGFELGCLVLEQFAREHPDVTIHLAGADVSKYKLPFRFVNHGVVAPAQLNELYNQCAAGLVLSLTNMSLLPLEMLGSGCVPVVNDGPNNRLVSDNPFIEYVEPSPAAMARRLGEVLTRQNQPEHARAAAGSVEHTTWEAAGARVEALLLRYVHGK